MSQTYHLLLELTMLTKKQKY